MANDRVFEWFAAAVENLCAVSELPVSVIPFDDNTRRMRKLAHRRGIPVLDMPLRVVDATEGAGRLLWPGNGVVSSLLRKIAVFEGPYENFVFSDVDVVFTSDVPSLMISDLILKPDLDVVAGWSDVGQTWAPDTVGRRAWDDGALSMNTGLWASRAGVLSPAELMDSAVQVVERGWHRDFAHVGDQPLINFALARKGVRYSTIPDLHPEMTLASTWSGHYKWWIPRNERPPYLHWAGEELPSFRMPALNLHLRWRLSAPYRFRGITEMGFRSLRR